MKAARWYGTKDVRIDNIPRPHCNPDEVIVKVAWCGICGSDVHEYESGPICIPVDAPDPRTGAQAPVGIGHEFSGTIVEIGSNVDGFAVGDRVVNQATVACLTCPACRRGDFTRCEHLAIYGIHGYGGGFAEYARANKRFINKVPDDLALDEAALAEPLSVGFHAVRISPLKIDDTAVVLGAGPIALGVIEALKVVGSRRIIAVARPSARQSKTIAAGADVVLDPDSCDAAAEIRALTGDGADVCFETFGVDRGLSIGQDCLKKGGCLVVISMFRELAKIDMMTTVEHQLTILGSNLYSSGDVDEVLSLLAARSIATEEYITTRIALDDLVEKGFETLCGTGRKREVKILVTPDDQYHQ